MNEYNNHLVIEMVKGKEEEEEEKKDEGEGY